jgi:hypothetical protein
MTTLVCRLLSVFKLISGRARESECRFGGVSDDLAIEIDRNDSPVSKPPAEWLVCFVPGLKKQWWHGITHPRHKHVFAIKMVGDDQWVIVEPWWTRIMITTLRTDEAVKFLRWGAAGSILQVKERIPGNGSQARGWANCVVLISLMLGRSYWTWTPHGFYKRLSAEDGVELVELDSFLEKKLATVMQGMTEEVLSQVSALIELSPEAAFMEFGRRISKIMFSPVSLSLYRLAVSEAPRFPAAAGAYFSYGPRQAVAVAKTLISHFCARGQFRECNQERASRALLSMLRGNLFQEIVLGCKARPDERDLELHTRSVVELFLRGTNRFALFLEPSDTEESIQPGGSELDRWEQITPEDDLVSARLPVHAQTAKPSRSIASNAIRMPRFEVKTASQQA